MRTADRLRFLVLTGGGTGLAPFASGTFGTLAGVLIAVILGAAAAPPLLGLLLLGTALALFAFGALQTGFVARVFAAEDPGAVVLDEVIGYLVTIGVFVVVAGQPGGWTHGIGFLAFRVLDVLKLPPADRLEELPGALGILCDDVAAGVQAGLVLLVLHACGLPA